jgi:MFS family permease
MLRSPDPDIRGLLARAPLAGRYGPAVAIALLALCPYIVLTTAATLVSRQVRADLHTSELGLQLASALANALYAFGAVVAADLVKRISARWAYLACEAGFVAGSLMAALAGGIGLFVVGRTLQGLATGMLLVAALPPLVTQHGPERIPSTAAYINLGLFGMVTLGPVVGGAFAAAGAWRLMFLAVAALGALGFAAGLLAFPRQDPFQPGFPLDVGALALALAGTVLPFLGVSFLAAGSFASPVFVAGVALGLAALVALVVSQRRRAAALMPVEPISHTLPVSGIVTAMAVGAAFTTLLELSELYLRSVAGHPPIVVGALVASQVGGLVVAALAFRRVLTTRWMPAFAFSGVLAVLAAGVLLLVLHRGSAGALVPVAAVLLGYGAGAGVTPGLFMAGLSVPSKQIGPTFALVELLRSEAAFLIAPVLLHVAMLASGVAAGVRTAVALTLGVLALFAAAGLAVLLLGGQRPHRPQLERWLEGEEPAYDSPPLLAVLRRRSV